MPIWDNIQDWLSDATTRDIVAWIASGVISVSSLVYGLCERYIAKKKSRIEYHKTIVTAQKLEDIHISLGGIFYQVDQIVQMAKQANVTVGEVQAMARGARGHVAALMTIIAGQKADLRQWRYGTLVPSDGKLPKSAERVSRKSFS